MSEGRYDASAIKIVRGLEAVRKRPAMYIGDIGKRGLHHLVFELVDNAIDEALAGYARRVVVTIHEDGSVSVEDDGRGIPVDVHPETGTSALDVVFTTLHAGGKFDKKAYKISGGLHGVGASVVNALSEWLEVKVKRNGKIYFVRYERGVKVRGVDVIGETQETGTHVRFKPDPQIFRTTEFDYDYLAEKLRDTAFLVPQVRIELLDERTGKHEVFHYENGLIDFIAFLNEARTQITPTFYMKDSTSEDEEEFVELEVALSYTSEYYETILSFANTIHTEEGGTHVTGFRSALTRVINDIGKKLNFLKEKDGNLSGEDVREGLVAVIHVKLRDPIFEGQTKTKLGNDYVRTFVEKSFYHHFYRWLEENPKVAQTIIEKALEARRARLAAKKAKEITRRKSFLDSDTLPGKLADCITKERDRAELFIVEGESAGGSAKQGRNREFQAILPLRGKIINVEKARLDRALSNSEIRAIISAIGCGLRDECDPEKARYGKIIIMTDADIDGAHIRTLLLSMFYRYFYRLIENGMVYIAQPPLYRVQKGKKVRYAYDEEELEKILQEWGDGVHIQRYKGLGEMNPEQLWETTMDPERRVLKRVEIEDAAEADRLISILMGNEVEPRRRVIEMYAKQVRELDI